MRATQCVTYFIISSSLYNKRTSEEVEEGKREIDLTDRLLHLQMLIQQHFVLSNAPSLRICDARTGELQPITALPADGTCVVVVTNNNGSAMEVCSRSLALLLHIQIVLLIASKSHPLVRHKSLFLSILKAFPLDNPSIHFKILPILSLIHVL